MYMEQFERTSPRIKLYDTVFLWGFCGGFFFSFCLGGGVVLFLRWIKISPPSLRHENWYLVKGAGVWVWVQLPVHLRTFNTNISILTWIFWFQRTRTWRTIQSCIRFILQLIYIYFEDKHHATTLEKLP